MATKRKWMVRSAAMLAFLLVMGSIFVATDFTQAQTTAPITGRVINSITKNPVAGVEVTMDSAENIKLIESVFTDADGRFTLNKPVAGRAYELGLSKRSYQLLNVGTDGSVIAPANLGNIELVPRGVTTPGAPALASSPKSVYIDWEANPEIDLKGYNVWRTPSNKDGEELGAAVKLNGTPNNVYDKLIVGTEYTDESVVKGQWYLYQIQAISGADRPSKLENTPYGGPERGQWLTIYYPSNPGILYSPGGMYLWQRQDLGDPLVRIPVCSRCIYDVKATDFTILSIFTSQLLNISPFEVETTGITAGIEFSKTIATITSERVAEAPVAFSGYLGDYEVSIAAAGTKNRNLYGTGELFNIYMTPKAVADLTCGPLHLVALDQSGVTDVGTVLYETLEWSGEPLDIMLEDGEICNGGGCIHGDADANGKVDLEDARHILKFIASPGNAAREVYKNICYMYAWDINLDKRVTTQDATLIMRFVENLPINPPPGIGKEEDDTMGSFAVAGAMAEEKGASANPKVWADIPSLAVGATANVPVYISDAAELAGFTLTVAYDATQVTLDNAVLGSAFPPNDYLIVVSDNAGEDTANRSVTISVVGAEEQGNKGAYELTELTFTRISGSTEPVPMSLTSIVINDEWGHAPRHTDPKAPKIENDDPCTNDQTPPVIVLIGETALSINCQSTYTDAGATATDNCDGNLTPIKSGSVNTDVPDVYTVRYNVSDAAGNAAAEVVRTVTVLNNCPVDPCMPDVTPPVITLTGNAAVSVNCRSTYVDAGATATDNCDGNLTPVKSGSVNTVIPGVYTVRYNVSDDAGNPAQEVSRTVTVLDNCSTVEGEGEPPVGNEGEPPVGNEGEPATPVVKKEVPNVVGKSEAEAVAALEAANFKAAIETTASKTAKGEVIEQTPAAGAQAEVGSTVKIVVSSGRRSIFSCGDAGGASGFGGDILLAALLVSLLAAAPQLRRRVN